MRFLTTLLLLAFNLGLSLSAAGALVRGAAVALEASGGVEIIVPGDDLSYESFDEPRYFPGIFSCRAQSGGTIVIQASNGVVMDFRGEGFFSVERFESLLISGEESQENLEQSRSHMILNIRRGRMVIDSRPLSEASRLVLETPFGRIAAVNAVFLVDIDFDRRSGIYDFTIASAEGVVRLSDLRQQSYTVYPGQRLSGAGSYVAPAIEIARQTEQVRQIFGRFFSTRDGLDGARIDRRRLQAHLQALPDLAATLPAPRSSAGSTDKRPRVIEFAPSTEFITPFRGELKQPSARQADLF